MVCLEGSRLMPLDQYGTGGSPLNRPGTSRASTARDSDFTKEPHVGTPGVEPGFS